MNNQSKFYLIIILSLIIVIFLQRQCIGNKNVSKNDTITLTSTIYTTVNHDTTIYLPKWYKKIVPIHDTSWVVDTAYVIGDYYSTYFYKDSLINGDTLKIWINDSVSENKIKSRNLKYSYKYATKTIINTIDDRKNEMYVGFNIIGNKTGLLYFGPEVLLKTKTKQIYGLGIGLDNNLKYNLSLKMDWKIGKK